MDKMDKTDKTDRTVLFEELEQMVRELKEEMKQKKTGDQEILEALASIRKTIGKGGKELGRGNLSGVLGGGAIGKLIENAEFLANFVNSYKQQFRESFFNSLLQKLQKRKELQEKVK